MTQKRLKELFDYHPDGYFLSKISYPGRPCGIKVKGMTVGRRGALRFRIGKKTYSMACLIFIWHHGCRPKQIDHIDIDCFNNRIENLRAANNSQNQWNSAKRKNNSSGYKGVVKHRNKWVAQITQFNKNHYLGIFDKKIEAAKAYDKAAKAMHGEFACTNF